MWLRLCGLYVRVRSGSWSPDHPRTARREVSRQVLERRGRGYDEIQFCFNSVAPVPMVSVESSEFSTVGNRIWSCVCVHRARARGDLVCCSYNSVAENIVRDHASPVTHTRRLYALRCTRVRCATRPGLLLEAGTPSSRLSGCGRGRGGPGPGGWLPEQPAAQKPQTLRTQHQPMSHRNLRQCPHATSRARAAR